VGACSLVLIVHFPVPKPQRRGDHTCEWAGHHRAFPAVVLGIGGSQRGAFTTVTRGSYLTATSRPAVVVERFHHDPHCRRREKPLTGSPIVAFPVCLRVEAKP